jgi:hypothetical protein
MCRESSGNELCTHSPSYIVEKWNRLVGVVPSIKLDDHSDNVLKWYNVWRFNQIDIMYIHDYVPNIVSFIDDLNSVSLYQLSPEFVIDTFKKRIGNFALSMCDFGPLSPCSLHPDLTYQFDRFMKENNREINLILLTDESDNCG